MSERPSDAGSASGDEDSASDVTREAIRDPRSFLQKYGKRALVSIGGFLLIIGGGVMLLTPGPGWLAIFGGLALLATEFVWAERLYERAKRRGKAAYDLATASKLRIAISVTLTLAGIAGVIWIWVIFR